MGAERCPVEINRKTAGRNILSTLADGLAAAAMNRQPTRPSSREKESTIKGLAAAARSGSADWRCPGRWCY